FQGEVLLLTRAGDPRPVLATLSAAERHDGGGIQRIGVFRDISREHELRFRVIREQKFRTLGSLAAGVAHNINNRLTPVLGWTEMLQERLGADAAIARDELKHALTVIHQGASDSVETVRRLQEYSRPARMKGPEAVQLRDVLEQLLALTRPQWDNEAARRGIRYEIELKADPAPAVLAVASEVREALLNILENALTAMPQGGRLTLHVHGEADRAVVSISDTGKGMSAEVQRLAVEDGPDVLDVLRAMLTGAGHTVVTAASGREALDLFEREAVDLVITDLGMPGMTGLTLAQELKRRRAVPVLLLTGWADELDAATVPSVDLVVAKPFTRERLFEALAHTLPDRVRPA